MCCKYLDENKATGKHAFKVWNPRAHCGENPQLIVEIGFQANLNVW
jgi:hypothetical protein